jgi:hypothetical protein
MREIVKIETHNIIPSKAAILENLSMPADAQLSGKVKNLFNHAKEIYNKITEARGIIADVTIEEFAHIYRGEGLNEKETPVEEIFKEADNLAIFASTVGEPICKKIESLFSSNEPALGSMLDAVASAGTDKTGDVLQEKFKKRLANENKIKPSTGILRYSPGYCGWHISGQKKMFEFLRPEEIGITLLKSYLMKPLKSISAVIISGEKNIHVFIDNYAFCEDCETRSCRTRIKSLFRTDEK